MTKTYADGDTLFEADLDNIKDDIENFVNVTKINDDNIQASGITGSTKLVDASVSSAKIASAAVTTSKIGDLAVTTAKINDLAVTTGKINDLGVTTGKINDLAVTTGKIADGAVTLVKTSNNYDISSSCGSADTVTSSVTFKDITNLTVTLTLTGRPVDVRLIPASLTSGGYISCAQASQTTGAIIEIYYGASTVIAHYEFDGYNAFRIPASSFSSIVEGLSAGSTVFKVKAKKRNSSDSVFFSEVALYVKEI